MTNELVPSSYTDYDIVTYDDDNPTISSPSADYDLQFKLTKSSIKDPEFFRGFLRNAESRFRRSKEYKIYKAGLMARGFDHCQVMGNVESSDMVDIELHHNIINLFDICILITEHIINIIGSLTTFDLVQLLIVEHFDNRVPVTFLAVTPHQVYTSDPEGYIPPDMCIGKWWELLEKYKYGVTFEIANKVKRYISKYRNQLSISIDVRHQEQILDFAYYNQFGVKVNDINGYNLIDIDNNDTEESNYELV